MTMHTTIRKAPDTEYWMGEVLAWAEASDEPYDAICELRKIPARMRMIDEDIGLIPAGLAHFDKVIAPTSYGAVSNAKDLEKARRRGNSRVRALLVRFHDATGLTPPRTGREEWDRLIALVKAHEGFMDRGALFATEHHKALFSLRARCLSAPSELNQEEIDRVFGDATTEQRKSIRKGVALINKLIAMQNVIPELRDLLPPVGFKAPNSPDRARRIPWSSIPEALRQDAEAIFRETLARPEDRAAGAITRLEAGEDPETVLAEVNAAARAHRRKIGNRAGARSGYQAAVTWLWRAADDRGRSAAATTLAKLVTRENLEAACEDQVRRSEGSMTLKDPKRTQTLNGRLGEKRKIVPIADLMRRGGFEHIARRIGDMRTEAASLPGHSARKALLLQTAAVCALDMNKPARTGDMSRWRLGHDLWRATDGAWRLAWRQGKTGRTTEAGELWPEISEILDELILCGRPDRLIHLRYDEVIGKNWLTLSDTVRPSRWPSERVKAAVGVPSHDLRTLAADYMRRHDPVIAARIISTHLGHATREAGKEYSALCEGDAAARAWQQDRRRIAAAG